jgi:hypothetical protein
VSTPSSDVPGKGALFLLGALLIIGSCTIGPVNTFRVAVVTIIGVCVLTLAYFALSPLASWVWRKIWYSRDLIERFGHSQPGLPPNTKILYGVCHARAVAAGACGSCPPYYGPWRLRRAQNRLAAQIDIEVEQELAAMAGSGP